MSVRIEDFDVEEINQPTPAEIIAAAHAILSRQRTPLLLSSLGQQLNRELNTSIRKSLGQKRLGDLLMDAFGDRYDVQGVGPHKEIGLRGTWVHTTRYPHYVDEFWKAFEKPLEPGNRRWIKTRPVSFFDSAEPSEDEDALEIEPAYVVDTSGIHDHKGRYIKQSINAWSEKHGVDLKLFERPAAAARSDNYSATPQDEPGSGDGVRSLRELIRAIPASERSKFTLPLDLLARLLDVI